MTVLTQSLWLPIGRANFFSMMSDHGLVASAGTGGEAGCASPDLANPRYVPHLRASVMRRLLEVLPRSFGYEAQGSCEFSRESDEQSRSVRLTMTLMPSSAPTDGFDDGRALANRALIAAGVHSVVLSVDENGNYTFTAALPGGVDETSRARGQDALRKHVIEVFGGDYRVDRLMEHRAKGHNEGAAAVRRYNGLADDSQRRISQPKGILTFFQLNIVVEGLCNESLLPAVFFEHYKFVTRWLERRHGETSILTSVAEVVAAIITDADASALAGQLTTLHRFLAVSRGSLQKLKWSVESVRRSLLDQMMGEMHRQSRLIQLDLGATRYERTPELAVAGTESQMRGYVMLVAAKLPLIFNVSEVAELAVDRIKEVRDAEGEDEIADHLLHDLDMQLHHWRLLLEGLRANMRSLEDAVEHDWRERMLYEQQQARSEQEAMAEIERSRRGRPERRRLGETTYNAIMLILTAAAVVITVKTTNVDPGTGWWQLVPALWPILVIALCFYLVTPVVGGLRSFIRERRASSDSYSFEFAFRLDEATTPKLVNTHLSQPKRQKVSSTSFRRMLVRRAGGERMERISPDTTLVKLHSVVAVRVSRFRYARFEVVNEVLARKVADSYQYFLRHCRVFGESPRPLPPHKVRALLRDILEYVCRPLARDGDINTDNLMLLADPIYFGRDVDEVPADSAEEDEEYYDDVLPEAVAP